MMLQDLARLLLKMSKHKLNSKILTMIQLITLITSWFWSHRPEHIEKAGLKTDVMLAAYGYQMMDEYIVNEDMMMMRNTLSFISKSLDY